MTDAERIQNYEDSYKRLWLEVERARKQRDDALKMIDVARDLILTLEYDFGAKTTVASARTHDAFNQLRSRLADL